MSSTNRGGIRSEADFYETPSWCVHRLLERLDLPGGMWFEPGAGTGNIIRAVNSYRKDVQWTALEQPEFSHFPSGLVSRFIQEDYLQFSDPERFDVIIGNPPYRLAQEFIDKSLPKATWVVMLLRLNFFGTATRQPFFESTAPDVFVLPNRPSFVFGVTDSVEYGWFVWPPDRNRKAGTIQILGLTDIGERRR
jgi:hypothetical protein